jgi:hypothetical protein
MLRLVRAFTAATTVLVFAACTFGDDIIVPEEEGGITSIGSTVTAATLARGGTTAAVLTIVREYGFTGIVTVSAEDVPPGVTLSFTPVSLGTTGTSSTMGLAVAPNAAPGTSAITIRASSVDAGSKTTVFTLTVLP